MIPDSNHLLEANRRPVCQFGAERESGRAGEAQGGLPGGGRSAKRWTKQRMTRFALLLLLVMGFRTFCYAEVTKLPEADQKALRTISRFEEVHAATNLPPAVFKLCADSSGMLAEAGQKWQVTDTITEDKLPTKRLVWAVTDGEYYVVHCERGGRGHTFHVLVARLKAGESKPILVWRAVGGRLQDFRVFLDAVASNKLDDRADYAH